MTETIRYALVGKEDLNLGTGTFEVRLADGRVVTLSQINVPDLYNSLTPAGVFNDLVTKGPWVDVRAYGAKGDGVTDDGTAITSAIAAVPPGGTLLFPPNYIFAYATSPNFAVNNLKISAYGATFKHTGSGNAFILDAGVSSGNIFNMTVEGITVQGNTNSTNGIFVRGVHHSTFRDLKVTGASSSGNGILINFAVANTWINPKVTVNEAHQTPMPTNGIYITRRGVGENATTQTIINPIMEGLSGTGITIDYARNNTIISGTSESNGYGLQITANDTTQSNWIENVDFESNTTNDILITNAIQNTFISNTATSTGGISVSGISNRNNFYGGAYLNITLTAGTNYNNFWGVTVNGSLTDGSTTNQYFASSSAGISSLLNAISTRNQIQSTLPTGTAPFSVASTTKVANLIVEGVGTQATSGTPAGTPIGGGLIFDTANFKLWAYTGSAWKFVQLA